MSCRQLLEKLNRRSTPIFPKFNRISKVCLFLFIAVSAILLTKQILAQNSIKNFQEAIQDGNNGQTWVMNAFDSNINTMIQAMGGPIPDSISTGETTPDGLPTTSFIPGGIIGITNNLIASTYNPPASGVQYLAQMKNNFLGKPAYAQGTGFTGLQPLLLIWRTFRNAIYILSALIFIILGIMIMLRVKVSQQAVITIQTAIPGLITTLILVTFSYAIAGLLIDAMNFVQALTITLIFNGLGVDLKNNLFGSWSFQDLNTPGFWDTWWLSQRILPQVIILLISGLLGGVIGGFIGLAGAAFTWGTSVLVGAGIGAGVAIAILEITILWFIIKFFISLIKCYLNVILKIILAPIEIAFGAFPNSKIGFGSWILDLIANLSVFPLCLLYLILINLLIDTNGLWAPPMISHVFHSTKILIGLGGILLLPKLPELIPQLIFQIKPSPLGKAIGEGVQTAGGLFKGIKGTGAYQAGAAFVKGRAGEKLGEKLTGSKFKAVSEFGQVLKTGAEKSRTTGEDVAKKFIR